MFPVPTAALRVALVPSKQTESIAADRDTERQDGGKDDGIMTAVEAEKFTSCYLLSGLIMVINTFGNKHNHQARHSLHISVR